LRPPPEELNLHHHHSLPDLTPDKQEYSAIALSNPVTFDLSSNTVICGNLFAPLIPFDRNPAYQAHYLLVSAAGSAEPLLQNQKQSYRVADICWCSKAILTQCVSSNQLHICVFCCFCAATALLDKVSRGGRQPIIARHGCCCRVVAGIS
jgi:hypothetical protein